MGGKESNYFTVKNIGINTAKFATCNLLFFMYGELLGGKLLSIQVRATNNVGGFLNIYSACCIQLKKNSERCIEILSFGNSFTFCASDDNISCICSTDAGRRGWAIRLWENKGLLRLQLERWWWPKLSNWPGFSVSEHMEKIKNIERKVRCNRNDKTNETRKWKIDSAEVGSHDGGWVRRGTKRGIEELIPKQAREEHGDKSHYMVVKSWSYYEEIIVIGTDRYFQIYHYVKSI